MRRVAGGERKNICGCKALRGTAVRSHVHCISGVRKGLLQELRNAAFVFNYQQPHMKNLSRIRCRREGGRARCMNKPSSGERNAHAKKQIFMASVIYFAFN